MTRKHQKKYPSLGPLRSIVILITMAHVFEGVSSFASDEGSSFPQEQRRQNILPKMNQNAGKKEWREQSPRQIDMKQGPEKRERQPELRLKKQRRVLGNADPRRYKNSWPECKGDSNSDESAMTASQCKQHMEHELMFHKLKNHVKVIVQSNVQSHKDNEIWIDTNRHGTVLGSNDSKDGLVKFDFTLNGKEVGPWFCIGLKYDFCCDSILKRIPVDTTGDDHMLECRRNIIYPTATVDAATDEVLFEEYVYDNDENQIVLSKDPTQQEAFGNAIIPIFIDEGEDGKVHHTPYLQAKIINLDDALGSSSEEGMNVTPAEIKGILSASASSESISLRQQSVAPMSQTHADSNVMVATAEGMYAWWMGLPLGVALFLVCCCCTSFYFLCCIPIKDENYLKETERVLEEANQKYHEKRVETDQQRQRPTRAASSSGVV